MNNNIAKIVVLQLLCVMTMVMYAGNSDTRSGSDDIINFKDPLVKSICVGKWDTNGDGKLSMQEAAEVKSLNGAFINKKIISFDEFQYFTSVNSLEDDSSLRPITLPDSLLKPFPYITFSTRAGGLDIIPYRTLEFSSGQFESCDALESIVLPNSIEIIGSNTFFNCKNLASVIIPSKVTEINFSAFAGCDKLMKIFSQIEDPNSVEIKKSISVEYSNKLNTHLFDLLELPETFFSSVTFFSRVTLYVPMGTKDKYKAASDWKEFKSIVEYDATGINRVVKRAEENDSYEVYSLDGKRIRSLKKSTFQMAIEGLMPGIYVINGRKILIR